jgi:hypothetical protein
VTQLASANSRMKGTTASTMGWDMVFATTVAEVNKAIEVAGCTPPSFSQLSPEGFTVKGDFDNWRLTCGGSQHIVEMILPIKSVELTRAADPSKNQAAVDLTVKDLHATVRVQLDFIKADVEDQVKNGIRHNLKFRTNMAAGEKIAHVDSVVLNSGTWTDPGFPVVIGDAMALWLDQNLAQIEHVFAILDLDMMASVPAFQWMMPSDMSYAMAPGTDEDHAILGVLCMTNKRKATDVIPQIAVGAVPDGKKGSVVIGYPTLMRELLIPGLPKVFKNTTVDDYTVDIDELGLKLNKAVKLDQITHEGKTYHPTMDSFTLRFETEDLLMTTVTSTDVSPGITSHTEVTSKYKLSFQKDANGKQNIAFKVVEKGTPNSWTTGSKALNIAGIVVAVIGAIAGIILIVASLGTLAVVGLTLIVLSAGLFAATVAIIKAVHEDDAPSIDTLIANANAPISWPKSGTFTPTSTLMDDALLLTGSFVPASAPMAVN